MAEISKDRPQTRDPRSRRPAREEMPAVEKQFQEIVINIDRVSRVVKGGRRFRFKALVVVGDGKNKVGIGVAKGADVQAAVAKATNVAKKQIVTIAIANESLPHDVEYRLAGAHVLLMPAAPGTGIIAGGVVRSVISVTGIRNLLSKSLGSTNKVNIAYATVEALKKAVPSKDWVNPPAKKVPSAKKAVKETK
jgi:small subunit ribosomal protein S5